MFRRLRYLGYFAFALILAANLLAIGRVSLAQTRHQEARFLPAEIPDDLADRILSLVTTNLGTALGDDRRPLPPLTQAEKSQPLLGRDLVKEVFDVGAASGIGEICGLNWQRENFLPLMRRERKRGDRTQHQIAAIGMIHGAGQQYASERFPCTQDYKAGTATFFVEKWGSSAPR